MSVLASRMLRGQTSDRWWQCFVRIHAAAVSYAQLQYHITSLTILRETRCRSADDQHPHRAFQRGRACTGGQTKGRTTKGCMQVPSAEVEFSPTRHESWMKLR